MALILAIEPDRRQAAQLTSLVRSRLHMELVLADTTERALVAIGNRVPDLVLIPTLLSPQEDAALAGALRVIAAAAHVQMLTIPVLAAPQQQPKRLGVLAKWRRGRAGSPSPDGCDPAVFGEQIAAYLAEATADLAEQAPEVETVSANETTLVASVAVDEGVEGSIERLVEARMMESLEEVTATPIDEQIAASAESPVEAGIVKAIEKPTAHWIEDPIAAPIEEDLAAAIDELVAEPFVEPSVYEPSVYELSVDEPPAEAMVVAAVVSLPDFVQERAVVEPVSEELWIAADEALLADVASVDTTPAPLFEDELWMPLSFGGDHAWPTLQGVPAEEPVDPPAPAPAPVSSLKPDRLEWIELIESLRLDVKRLRTERPRPAPIAPAARADRAPVSVPVSMASPRPPTQPAVSTEVRQRTQARQHEMGPIHDEWGFFDPEQCGFAALLAKLEEITEANEKSSARSA